MPSRTATHAPATPSPVPVGGVGEPIAAAATSDETAVGAVSPWCLEIGWDAADAWLAWLAAWDPPVCGGIAMF